jgi:hypothetical protein
MKYHTLTLPDTKGAMIANVTMIKKIYIIFLLNIEMDVPKCMCEE